MQCNELIAVVIIIVKKNCAKVKWVDFSLGVAIKFNERLDCQCVCNAIKDKLIRCHCAENTQHLCICKYFHETTQNCFVIPLLQFHSGFYNRIRLIWVLLAEIRISRERKLLPLIRNATLRDNLRVADNNRWKSRIYIKCALKPMTPQIHAYIWTY